MYISCHELHFEGDSSNGADLTKKYVSKDLFFCGAPHISIFLGEAERYHGIH